jgi:hypothetical protein
MRRNAGIWGPVLAFAAGFSAMGWLASHCLAYSLVGATPAGAGDAGQAAHVHGAAAHAGHGYLGALPLPAVLLTAFGLALVLRWLFAGGSFTAAVDEGGTIGTWAQLALATAVPAAVFVLVELAQHGGAVSPALLAAGVAFELVIGACVLVGIRFALRAVERHVRRLGARRARCSPGPEPGRPSECILAPLGSPLAGRRAGRAPPAAYA